MENASPFLYDWVGIAAVIGAIGTIILGVLVPVLTSRSSRREKELEHKFSLQEKEIDLKLKENISERRRLEVEHRRVITHCYSLIYGYLWNLLYKINADRICVVQPHPEQDRQFISQSIEVLNPERDVSSQRENFHFRKMSEWAGVISKWTDNEFLVYTDINQIKNLKLYTEAYRRGIKSSIFYRLTDQNGYWRGTIAVDYTHEFPNDITFIKVEISNIGVLIADILPEYVHVNDDLKYNV